MVFVTEGLLRDLEVFRSSVDKGNINGNDGRIKVEDGEGRK